MQVDLSLLSLHKSHCRFCHALAQILTTINVYSKLIGLRFAFYAVAF